MEIKIYKLLSSAKKVVFVLAATVFSTTAYSQATYTLNYTGSVQTLTLNGGTYSINAWGGDGYTQTSGYNGRGGYASGILTLASTQTIYIYVGGLGGYPSSGVTANAWTFNGGGIGYPASNALYGNGGGASDVRTVGGLWDNSTSLASRVIVAGGGGAGRNASYIGGNGGGSTGGTGTYFSPDQTGGPTGGTQSAGGTNTGYTSGLTLATLGKAMTWDGTALTANFLAGGGGYYGGGSGRVAGGGGSSYLGGVSSGTTIMFGQAGFVANPDVTGNGVVIIKELCSITLAASNATLSNSTSPVICSGQSLTLTTNAISNYSWSTGATTSSLVVAPTVGTVYTLTAMSPSNCTTSRTISVTVSGSQPTLSVVSSTNQTCLGKTATLTASGAVTYTWTNGVTNGVSFYPSTTTTYTVTGQNGCGTVTAVSTISVNPLAVTAVSSASAICTNKTATLSVTAAANSYTFNPGNVTGASPNLIVNPQTNTNYTITVSDGTCSGVATVSLVANPVPTISAAASSSIVCPGGTVGLSATGGINYTWTPVNLNGASITDTPTISTLYNVTGDNSFGCLNNASQVVVVGTTPTLVLSSNSPSICGGGSATLTVSGADTYAWTGGPTTTVYVVNPSSFTTYTVTGTNSSSGCSDTKNISISVFTPTISVSGGTAVCAGNQVNLTASGGNSYTWSPGSLQFPSIQVVPVASTIYTVDALATDGVLNCPGSTTFQVVVNPNPTVTTSSVKPAICAKETNTYNASGASTYTWTSNAGTVVGPSITVTSSVTALLAYTVAGTNAQGCVSESNFVVTINSCLGLDQPILSDSQLLVYPNPSSGEFQLQSTAGLNLSLINELGQIIRILELNETNGHHASVTGLSNGVYFLVGNSERIKVMVNR